MIYRWKETNGGKGGSWSKQKHVGYENVENKVLDKNKGDSELMVNMKKFFKWGWKDPDVKQGHQHDNQIES